MQLPALCLAGLGLALFVPPVAAQTSTSAAPVRGGQQGGMMGHCPMHNEQGMAEMERIVRLVEEARTSNDTAKMRAALDAVAKHHSEMKAHMQNMRGAGQGMRGGGRGRRGGGHMHHGGRGAGSQGTGGQQNTQQTGSGENK